MEMFMARPAASSLGCGHGLYGAQEVPGSFLPLGSGEDGCWKALTVAFFSFFLFFIIVVRKKWQLILDFV